MKKFTFELQSVLEYRDFQKQQAESELAQALAVETKIKKDLDTIALQYTNLKLSMKGNLSFDEIYAANQHYKLLDYQKEELLKQLAEANIVTEQKREVLRECMKKTTALEKLKEQQLEEYKKEVQAVEAKFADEIGTQGYFRKQQNGDL